MDTLEKHLSSRIGALRCTVAEHDDRNRERFASRQEAVKIASDAAKEASDKATTDLRERMKPLENIITRSEYDIQHRALERDVQTIASRLAAMETTGQAKREGFSSLGSVILGLFAGIAASGTIGMLLFNMLHK